MRKPFTLAVTLACLAALVACSNDEDTGGPLVLDDESTSAGPSSPGGSEPASPTGSPTPGAADDDVTVRAGDIDLTGPRRAVADALLTYLDVRLTAYNQVQVDLPDLAAASVGDATQQVQRGVAYLRQEKLHTVGELRVDVDQVRMSGRNATLRSCADNATADANKQGRVVELDAPSHYDISAKAIRVAQDTWLISDIEFASSGGC